MKKVNMEENEEVFNKIVELRNKENLTYKEIAERMGVSITTVYNNVKKARELGLVTEEKREKVDEVSPRLKRIVKLYNDEKHLTYEEIANIEGVSTQTVYNHIKKAIELGLVKDRRKVAIKDKPKFKIVVELYNSGENLTQKEIAKRSGVSQNNVGDYIKIAKELGMIKERERSKMKENPKFQKAVKLYNETELTMTEIAKEIGVTLSTINTYIYKAKELGLAKEREKAKQKKNKKQSEMSLDDFTEQIKEYIKNKKYKQAIERIGDFRGYFKGVNDEEIKQAREEIKQELRNAKSNHIKPGVYLKTNDVSDGR